jgi:hypothetical protein
MPVASRKPLAPKSSTTNAGGIECSDAEERCYEPAVWKQREPTAWKEPMIDERRSSDKGGMPNKPATEAAETANMWGAARIIETPG